MSPPVAVRRGHLAGQFGLLLDPFGRVGQQVVGKLRGHQARAGQGQGDAAGVDGDPAPAPLLGDVGGCAAAACRVEHQIAGVGGHEEATLDDLWVRLHNVDLLRCKTGDYRVCPSIVERICRKVVDEANVVNTVSGDSQAASESQSLDSVPMRFPFARLRKILLAIEFNRVVTCARFSDARRC